MCCMRMIWRLCCDCNTKSRVYCLKRLASEGSSLIWYHFLTPNATSLHSPQTHYLVALPQCTWIALPYPAPLLYPTVQSVLYPLPESRNTVGIIPWWNFGNRNHPTNKTRPQAFSETRNSQGHSFESYGATARLMYRRGYPSVVQRWYHHSRFGCESR